MRMVNLIGDAIRTLERNAEVLLNACIGLAVNTGKTNYMEIGRHRVMIANEHQDRINLPLFSTVVPAII